MLTHLYLPLLQEGKSPQMPEVSGKWDTHSRRILLAIADGIVIDEHAAARGVSSVPDAWARPLMFASALRPGSRHPLRDRLVGEWRGLLSLLALSRVHKHDLELARVALQPGVFADALKQLAPAPVRLEAEKLYNWTDVVIVRYEGIPVGGLSPQTLVYTGTDYASRLAATTLSLKNANGFLAPPRDREEKLAVAEWVVQLQRRLVPVLHADQHNESHETVGLINRLLKDWEVDLRSELGLGERDDIDSAEVDIDEDPLAVRGGEPLLAAHRVYREILRPLAPADDHSRVATDLALQSKRNLSEYTTVVVISRSLVGSNARIWDAKRLNSLGGDVEPVLARHFKNASGTLIDKEDLAKRDAVWIRPERYFLSDVLVKAKRGTKFVAESEATFNRDARFVLPFTRQILDFFSPEDLQELDPEFTRESEQSITFRFKLPVGSTTERVEKTYRYKNPEPGEGTLVEVDVPIVELFPRYLDSSWRRYFLFQQDTSALVASPVVTADHVTMVTRDHTDAQGQRVLITATTGDTVRDEDGKPLRLPFPEAVAFSTSKGRPAGIVLLAQPSQPRARSGKWRVGIDFGTSNTNVFRQSGRAAEAERWEFRFPAHVHAVTASRVPTRSEYLLPNHNVPLPIATHLRIHQEPTRQHPLLDYFMDLAATYQIPENVYTNIKWEDKDRKADLFLEGLLLMILVDAVRERVDSVKFAYSYPKAFSQNQITVFNGEWDIVMRKVLEGPDRLLEISSKSDDGYLSRDDDVFRSEGEAAGEFFGSKMTGFLERDRAKKENEVLCLDVGGGTTDISIWFGDKIVADASVKLAGRQIGEMLCRHFRILELLLPSPAIRPLEEQRNVPDQFAARLNIALRKDDQHVRDMLIKHSNAREVQALKRLLVCEFGAIAFYAAQLIPAADRRAANGQLLPRFEASGVNMYWGGNAAKFLNWIDFGRFDKSGIGPMFLNAVVYNALQDLGTTVKGQRIAQHQSTRHKSEAAGGLVVMNLDRRDAAGPSQSLGMQSGHMPGTERVVCGENIELTSGNVTYLDELGENDLFQGQETTFVGTSLDRLRRFVEIVNYFGVQRGVFTNDSKIALDDDLQVQIADTVRSEFVKAQSIREGHREIEPVFIMEVKVLLDLLKDELGR